MKYNPAKVKTMEAYNEYKKTNEGVAVDLAGDLIYEAQKSLELAFRLLRDSVSSEVLDDLRKKTEAQARAVGDLSDAWTEQSFARVLELYPDA